MSLYQEVRLYTNASQREAFDNRAELYSIIKTIQELEVSPNCVGHKDTPTKIIYKII